MIQIETLKSITSDIVERNGYLFLNKEKKGVYTLDVSEIIPIEYEKVIFVDGLFAVYKNKKDPWYSIMGYYSILGIKYF